MKFLVVGSSLEAVVAREVLSEVSTVEKVWGLPSPAAAYSVLSPVIFKPALFRQVDRCEVSRIVLRDRWGRRLFALPLEGHFTLRTADVHPSQNGKAEELDAKLSIVRTIAEKQGVLCSFDDGSELACDGVLYCDGPVSQGRRMLLRSSVEATDPTSVTCWSFVRRDLLRPNAWEFRTALGKSVEQLPLPGGMVRVKLRFRSSFGPRQSAAELKVLFSEFGPDMEALLEGIEPPEIVHTEERAPTQLAFSPTPGTFALGEAALGVATLQSFDWSTRVARRQLERVVESILVGNWEPSAFEPHSREVLEPVLRAERHFRRTLHYDNVLLRPLRDLLLRLTPESVLRERARRHLLL